MSSLNLTPKLFSNFDFACLSLIVTAEKANACSPWTSCFEFYIQQIYDVLTQWKGFITVLSIYSIGAGVAPNEH